MKSSITQLVILAMCALTVIFSSGCINSQVSQGWEKVYEKRDERDAFYVNDMVSYNDQLYAGFGPFSPPRVKRYDGGINWTQVNEDNFGDPGNDGVSGLEVFNGLLYAVVDNYEGVEVWSYDGKSWLQINQDGFGEPVGDTCRLCVYNGKLYASYFMGYIRYENDTNWTRIDEPHMDLFDPGPMISWNGYLYTGASDNKGAAVVWRYDGSSWEKVSESGFGEPERNLHVPAFAVYDNQLYAGVQTALNYPYGASVYRFDGGTSWARVSDEGFGDRENVYIADLAVYNDQLLVGTQRRSKDDDGQIWSYNGSEWNQVNTEMLKHQGNWAILSLCGYEDDLYTGTANFKETGAQVWRLSGEAITVQP